MSPHDPNFNFNRRISQYAQHGNPVLHAYTHASGGTDPLTGYSADDHDHDETYATIADLDVAELTLGLLDAEVAAARDPEASLGDRLIGLDTYNSLQDSAIADLQAATAKVYARASTNTARALTSGANVLLDYEDETIDSHGYLTVGASWKFQPAVSGWYRVFACFQVDPSGSWGGDTNNIQIGISKNGTVQAFARTYATGASDTLLYVNISDIVELNGSTDYINMTMGATWTGIITVALSGDARLNYVYIERI